MKNSSSSNGRGKLIAIEGVDGSGKATQTKELIKNLKKEGMNVKTIDFPQYENNFFGKFIGECLSGEHGDFSNLDPKITSVLFAADRFESSKKIKKWLEEGYVVVVDRYASSNQIHQGGKIQDAKERKEFLEWSEKMEYEIFGIPRPDAIIFLSVSLKVSLELSEKESKKKVYLKGKKDVAESDFEYMKRSQKNAVKIIKEHNNWIDVQCVKDGEMRSIDDISGEILGKVINVVEQ